MAAVLRRWDWVLCAAAAWVGAACAGTPQPVVPTAIPEVPAPSRSGAAAPTGNDGRFARLAPRIGDRHETSSDTTITLSIDAGSPGIGTGGRLDISQHDTVTFVEEVLAVEDGATTRASVTVVRAEKASSYGAAKGPTTTSPIQGKTYLLSMAKGGVQVSEPDGRPAAGDEARELRDHFRSFGEPDAISRALPTEPLRAGTPVPALARALAHLVARGSNAPEVTSSDATFRGTVGDAGVFDVSLTLGGGDDTALGFPAELRGEVHVSHRTGAATHVSLSGPITIAGGGGAFRGGGTISVVADSRSLP